MSDRGGGLIGFAGPLASRDGAPSLIYGVAAGHSGQGCAAECGVAVLDYALNTLRLPSVEADMDEPNVASVRVLWKLGMTLTGHKVVNGRPLRYYAVARGRAV